jgi:glutamine synthetase
VEEKDQAAQGAPPAGPSDAGGGLRLDDRERARRGERAATIAAELSVKNIAAVALTWVDTSGITRTKAVPVRRLEEAAAWGVGMSPVFDAFLLDDSIVQGRYAGGPIGDLRLHPVLERLVPMAGMPGWAWAPAERFTQDEGTEHLLDARRLLRQEVARLAAQGLSVRTAFEVEWAVSEGDGEDFTPACNGPAYGMTRIAELSEYLRDLLRALEASKVTVVQIHPEYAAGQLELSVAPQDPIGAADTLVLVRETIRAVSFQHDMVASFSPKVLADGVGNGGHVHLSLWRDDSAEGPVNAMAGGEGPYGMTEAGEAFTAGILERLPALLAVGAPSVASYLRLIPSHWAGAFSCWGLENREAALRFITGPAGIRARAANLEVKCFDGAANPYLALAALLAAGRAGIGGEAVLPEPVDVDPVSLSGAERAARGIAPVPSSLEEALRAFESDPVLREAFGEELIDTVAVVRRGEIELFDGASPEEVATATRWRH